MKDKINIAELLKDCPKGMELDCTIFDDVYFDYIDDVSDIINCYIQDSTKKIGISFSKYGCYSSISKSKCVIFPKGKTTWEGFQRPFNDGDIIFTHANCLKVGLGNTWISIFQEKRNGGVATYVDMTEDGKDYYDYIDGDKGLLCMNEDIMRQRLATEEEKEKLFKVIRDNGYHWNEDTKTLEKLIKSKFHESDWITNGEYTWKVISVDYLDYTLQNQWGEYVYDTIDYVNKAFHLWTINDAKNGDVLFHSDSASNGIFIFKEILQRETIQKVICYCDYDSEDGFCLGDNHTCCWTDSKILHPATKEQRDLLFKKMKEAGYKWNAETKILDKLVEPKFKVGDKVKSIFNNNQYIITKLTNTHYTLVEVNNKFQYTEPISEDKNWKLTPNKFDITTLKHFDKVIARDCNEDKWNIDFFGYYRDNGTYQCMTFTKNQCIPYKGNEHLLGKTDDCDEYYKTWK